MTKDELRAAGRARRAAIPAEGKARLDAIICRRIAESQAFEAAATVLLYAPVKGEIDLLPLVKLCRTRGKRVAFPVTRGEELRFLYLEEGAALSVQGRFGIPEPPADAEVYEADRQTLCIVPGLCFDACGNRLGYGKGYYDRFLEHFEGRTLGAVYGKLMVREIPTEPHDRPVELLVSERGLFSAKAEADGRADAPKQSVRERLLAPLRQVSEKLRSSRTERQSAPVSDGSAVQVRHAPMLLVLATFVLLILSRLIEGSLSRRGSEYVAVILSQIMVFAVPALLYIQLRGERFPARIRLRGIRPEHLWFCFCTLVVMITGSLLISILTGGIASLGGTFTLYDIFTARNGGGVWETVYILLAYALLPAVCEELIYRSVLCAEYESAGVGISVVVSSLLFAMLHFSFPLFPNYLFAGLLLATALYTTRSTLAPMLLHLCYNLFCLFGQPYLSAFYVNAGSNDIFVFCLVVLFLLFAAFGAGQAGKIYHRYAEANASSAYTTPVRLMDYPRHAWRALRSPVALAVVAVWLVMAIISALS